MSEHPEDICNCGDYRRDHPDNGACKLNGLGHNIPDYKCERFRLSLRAGEVETVLKRLTEPRLIHVNVKSKH